MHKNIYIFSGQKQSGKTTSLLRWASGRTDVSGIVSPVIDGKRMFMNIADGEIFPMEKDAHEQQALYVGKYVFSVLAFEKAAAMLLVAARKKSGWLVLDEIGPLELRGEGFCKTFNEILYGISPAVHIIIVVRQELLADVLHAFEIKSYIEFVPA